MNPKPEIGTIEHCKLVLAEWKAKAEASEKERAELVAQLNEAMALLYETKTLSLTDMYCGNSWKKRRNAFLASTGN